MNSQIAPEEGNYIAAYLGKVVKKKYTRLNVMSGEFNVS
jgi:hypothetical protein